MGNNSTTSMVREPALTLRDRASTHRLRMILISNLSKVTVLLNRAITIRATTTQIAAPLHTHRNNNQAIMIPTSSTALLSSKDIMTLNKVMAASNMANLVLQVVLRKAIVA